MNNVSVRFAGFILRGLALISVFVFFDILIYETLGFNKHSLITSFIMILVLFASFISI